MRWLLALLLGASVVAADAAENGNLARWRRGVGNQTDINPNPPDPPPGNPAADAGAKPIGTYVVTTLPGNEFYMSPGASGSCTSGSPCGTFSAAQSAASSGDSIVVNAGTYRAIGSSCVWSGGACAYTGQTTISKALTIAAAPNTTPVFNGAQDVTAGPWTTEGSLKYIAYSPIPVSDGSGITPGSTGSNMVGGGGGAGRFPDQVWIGATGSTELQQVTKKASVTDEQFYVDSTFTLAGTATVVSGSATITGSGTFFAADLVNGDSVTVAIAAGGAGSCTAQTANKIVSGTPTNTSLTFTTTMAFATTSLCKATVRRNGLHRLYITAAKLAAVVGASSTIEVCNKGNWLSLSATVAIKGISVIRYCNTPSRNGVVIVNNTADNSSFEDFSLIDFSVVGISVAGASSDLIDGVTFNRVTVDGGNWIGVNPTGYASDIAFHHFRCTGSDRFEEWTSAPGSGCIKFSRTYNLVVDFSLVANNRSSGIWMDQSVWNAVVCSNTVSNNGVTPGDNSFFFEISAKLVLCNNLFLAPSRNAAKLSASSEMVVWNNTFVGGSDAVGFYADSRSSVSAHCADPAFPFCNNSPNSDRWLASSPARDPTLDWMPRMSVFKNNIVINPTSAGLCGTIVTALCILTSNQKLLNSNGIGSDSTLQSMIHLADPARGIPQTQWNNNLYAFGTAGKIIVATPPTLSYTQAQLAAWTTYLAGAPVNIAGIDANSIADPTGTTYVDGLGEPTGLLDHDLAAAVPVDAILNLYLPPGTKRFGKNF